MVSYASTADSFGRRFEEMMEGFHTEIRNAVAFVDAVVIPEVRRESGSAMRTAAIHIEKLADKLDPAGKRSL